MLALVAAWSYGYGLALAALIAWIFVWCLVAVRVVRRRDLGVGGKLLWIVVILLVPVLGLFVYFLWDAARPRTT
jgi:Phospholipase_D-nuclease N-terminal